MHKDAKNDMLNGITKLEKELQSEVEKVKEEHYLKMQELYDEQDDEFRKNDIEDNPECLGSYSDLSRYGEMMNGEFQYVSGLGSNPEFGDFVFVVTKKKKLGLVQIGDRVNESADWTIFYFEKLRELPSQEFGKIIPILDIVKQKMKQ